MILAMQPFSFWRSGLICFLLLGFAGGLSAGCLGTMQPASSYPPTASDLALLPPLDLCQPKAEVLIHWQAFSFTRSPWGAGEQWLYDAGQGAQPRYRWLFFSEDRILIGAVFGFVDGLSLAPYPTLRHTLSQLSPAREFFLNSGSLLHDRSPPTAVLYRTGDKTTTTQYLVFHSQQDAPLLLIAVFVLDPYEPLLDGMRPEFLRAVYSSDGTITAQPGDGSSEGLHKQPFLAIQQFARGEAALFGSCGAVDNDLAISAYRRAIEIGLDDPLRLAHAHYRLGLALRNTGQYLDALKELDYAIHISPIIPAFHNARGTLLLHLGERDRAIEEFERAIALKPNYAQARYNLAEILESINPQRAIEEYETYLSLVEGREKEIPRAREARERLRRLKR
ncbi:MAG: tetratricopeptide repeat protein [Nitrospirae bacterium]|nr:MAG: tetratricopeptide repeat protein [Nitrospirota bacterium]